MNNRKDQPEWMRKMPHRESASQSLARWSQGRSGPYMGKGSRFYSRSDERVYEDICERMMKHGQLDASQIEVQVENGEVVLTGNVANRQIKRLAEDIAESVPGVRDIHNRLQFRNREDTPNRWVDQVGHSGVYPASGAEDAPADAEAQGMASWGQGERGAEGYDDHGESELHIGHQDKE